MEGVRIPAVRLSARDIKSEKTLKWGKDDVFYADAKRHVWVDPQKQGERGKIHDQKTSK